MIELDFIYVSIENELEFSVNTYYRYWFILLGFLEYNSNVILYLRDEELVRVCNFSQVGKILKVSRSTSSKFMKECLDKGYIIYTKVFYRVNPDYAYHGEYKSFLAKYCKLGLRRIN